MKNRTLKFRGFYQGKPVYFTFESIYGNKCGTPCVVINKPHDVVMGGEYISIHILENVTLFTGLLDQNGKEIYDGDIIQKNTVNNPPEIKLVVSYDSNKARYIFKDSLGYDYNFYSDYYEVIGNIFENPELLKK